MCLPATQRILINNKTGSDPLKCPELMPFTESLPLSLDTYMKRCRIQTATFFFLFLFVKSYLENVYESYELEVGRKSEKWQLKVIA